MQAEAWEIAKSLDEYTAVVPAEFSRIHEDDERVIVAVVHDWRQFERHGDHSGFSVNRFHNRP